MTAIHQQPTRLPAWRYTVRQVVAACVLIAGLISLAEGCHRVTGIDLCAEDSCYQTLPITK